MSCNLPIFQNPHVCVFAVFHRLWQLRGIQYFPSWRLCTLHIDFLLRRVSQVSSSSSTNDIISTTSAAATTNNTFQHPNSSSCTSTRSRTKARERVTFHQTNCIHAKLCLRAEADLFLPLPVTTQLFQVIIHAYRYPSLHYCCTS